MCLGGGGARGYAHIGAIRALTEVGIKIDIVNGTSIGAVVGGIYALYQNVDKMVDLTKQVVGSVNINHFNLLRYPSESQSFLRSWLNEAICDVAALRKSIQSHKNNKKTLGLLFDEYRFEDTKIPFSAVATDIISGKTTIIKRGKLIDGVLASVFLPGIFPPVTYGKKQLIDGFVLSNIPVSELRWEGADFIISVELVSIPINEYRNGTNIPQMVYYALKFRERFPTQFWVVRNAALIDCDTHQGVAFVHKVDSNSKRFLLPGKVVFFMD